ncbi:MAG: YihY/virulence factor BrkB family protein, partial [Actinomycetota bacterium]|nr:YihY/virulence factor BrkB family protein [Actinomycetota bacterium]
MIVLVSLLGIFGDQSTIDSLLNIIQSLAPGEAASTFEGAIEGAVNSERAGTALVIGLALALYSSSGYIGAFSRAANDIYEVPETRPFWKTLPRQVGLTAVLMIGLAVAVLGLVITGPLAEAIGE